MLDVHWTLTVQVPQLDNIEQAILTTSEQLRLAVLGIGEELVASIDSIKAEIVRLNENQAASSAALTDQVTKIAEEVAQMNASGTPVTDEQMTNLETALKAAADAAAEQTASIEANTQLIQGMVPDEPPA